jgi:SAM-dependent methyltransferase
MTDSAAATAWEHYQTSVAQSGEFSRWPNEAMLKVLFGKYLGTPRTLSAGQHVIDVGCGMGQNLIPFAAQGCEVAGIELTEQMTAVVRNALSRRGISGEFRVGHNRAIPFPDACFDLVLSVNAIHYEKDETDYLAAIQELARVIKPGGRLYVSTVAPEHEIYQRAEVLGPHRFCIRDYDFRNGEKMFFVDHEKHLAAYLGTQFADVETGHVIERLMTRTLGFYLAVATKAA